MVGAAASPPALTEGEPLNIAPNFRPDSAEVCRRSRSRRRRNYDNNKRPPRIGERTRFALARTRPAPSPARPQVGALRTAMATRRRRRAGPRNSPGGPFE